MLCNINFYFEISISQRVIRSKNIFSALMSFIGLHLTLQVLHISAEVRKEGIQTYFSLNFYYEIFRFSFTSVKSGRSYWRNLIF